MVAQSPIFFISSVLISKHWISCTVTSWAVSGWRNQFQDVGLTFCFVPSWGAHFLQHCRTKSDTRGSKMHFYPRYIAAHLVLAPLSCLWLLKVLKVARRCIRLLLELSSNYEVICHINGLALYTHPTTHPLGLNPHISSCRKSCQIGNCNEERDGKNFRKAH